MCPDEQTIENISAVQSQTHSPGPEALLTRVAVVALNMCVCVCVYVWLSGCEQRDREGVCAVRVRVCVCSALRGGRLRLSQREVGRLATR